uniref:Fatty acid synthase-like n=1 Tax=Diabrotica virgifera virgifera TaxID=50390 RepID=A0A6P7GXA3_DIAVI
LYVNGNNPQLAKLYPEVSFPVSRGTRMISPFIKWEHTRDWFVPSYDIDLNNAIQYGARSVPFQLADQEWTFVQGHIVDGRNLFPATGYLFLAWDTLCLIEDSNIPFNLKQIIFEDVKFLRDTTVPKTGGVSFTVCLNITSGRFEIVEGGTLIVTGKIYSNNEDDATYCGVDTIAEHANSLTGKDVYKELRLRGYNY